MLALVSIRTIHLMVLLEGTTIRQRQRRGGKFPRPDDFHLSKLNSSGIGKNLSPLTYFALHCKVICQQGYHWSGSFLRFPPPIDLFQTPRLWFFWGLVDPYYRLSWSLLSNSPYARLFSWSLLSLKLSSLTYSSCPDYSSAYALLVLCICTGYTGWEGSG